jgi:hypothetical protein
VSRGLSSSAEQVRGHFGETGQRFSSQAATQQSRQKQCPALLVAPSLSDAPDALQLIADERHGSHNDLASLVQNADPDVPLSTTTSHLATKIHLPQRPRRHRTPVRLPQPKSIDVVCAAAPNWQNWDTSPRAGRQI